MSFPRRRAAAAVLVVLAAGCGSSSAPGDCNLTAMQGVAADANGRVQAGFTVVKGPFGANNIVCGPSQACLISVTQATPSPSQEADAPITFG